MNIGPIANLSEGGERADKTAQFTYWPCHDTIRTEILHWNQRCGNCIFRTAVRFQPGQKPTVQCPVWVSTPARQSGSGFWPGLELNWTELLAKNQSAGGLPGSVTNNSYNYNISHSQAFGRPPPATYHSAPDALPLQLNTTLDPACKSTFGMSRVFHRVVEISISHHHRPSAWWRTEWLQVDGNTGMTEMDWGAGVSQMDGAMGSIYSGDPGVDRSHIILSCNESHTLCFPFVNHTRSFWDCMDRRNCVAPHGWVVSYLLNLFLCSKR